jgi:fumarate hydratase class II
VLQALRILGDASEKFHEYSVRDTQIDRARIQALVGQSLMLVTALAPILGYDRAAAIAHLAQEQGLSLREAALRSGLIDARGFDAAVRPEAMVGRDPA